MTPHAAQGVRILDDGEYYVELNKDFTTVNAPGFLQRRCYDGVTTPDGYESVGRFDRDPQRGWHACIDAPYDPIADSSCRNLGRFSDRMDAIVAFWFARRDALCRHRSE